MDGAILFTEKLNDVREKLRNGKFHSTDEFIELLWEKVKIEKEMKVIQKI